MQNSTTTTPPLAKSDITKTHQEQEVEADDARDISLALEESFRTLEREGQNADKTGINCHTSLITIFPSSTDQLKAIKIIF